MLNTSDVKIIKDLLKPLQNDIAGIRRDFATKDDINGLKIDISDIRKNFATKDDLKPIGKDIAKIKKDVKTLINFFDRENIHLVKRVGRIEDYLKLSAAI